MPSIKLNDSSLGIVFLILLMPAGVTATEGVIPGWSKGGPDPRGYVIGTEATQFGTAAYIRSENPTPGKYGMIYQRFTAEEYRGKRYRLSARIKTENVAYFAVMWMRVDHEMEIVAIDNMMSRPIQGITDWQQYSIVLDVPQQSDALLFGLALSGEGKAAWGDITFEEVGLEVPVTGYGSGSVPRGPQGPVNLDFDK